MTKKPVPDLDEADGAAIDLGLLPKLLGYSLRRAQVAVFQDFHRSMGDLEIGPAQFAVMHLLRRNSPLRSSQIAEALGIKRTNFVVLLEQLERSGLVERRRDPQDGRASTIHLLPEGEELMRKADRHVRTHEKRIAKRLEEGGAEHLLRLLGQLTYTD